MAVQKLLIKFG